MPAAGKAVATVVVVHPRHPELCLGAPSQASSDGETKTVDANAEDRIIAATLRAAHQRQEELLILRRGRLAAAAHGAALAAAPSPSRVTASPSLVAQSPSPSRVGAIAAARGGTRSRSRLPPSSPPCVGGPLTASCLCNVSTLYD
jgi:hypothetical protein